MIPNALGSRVAMDETSVFWRFSVEIPIWFLVLVGIIVTMVRVYVVKEIRRPKEVLHSWRCFQMIKKNERKP